MAQYFARIVRAVIVSVLGFGGGIGLLTFIAILVLSGQQKALEIGWHAALVIGFGFGTVLAVVFLLTDLTARLSVARGGHEEIWDLEQTREFDFDGTGRELRHFCREALLAVPNVKTVIDDNEFMMTASIGASWKSPGEKMQIAICPLPEDKWHVKCVSCCLASHVAFDYAKNFENIETWLRTFQKLREETKVG